MVAQPNAAASASWSSRRASGRSTRRTRSRVARLGTAADEATRRASASTRSRRRPRPGAGAASRAADRHLDRTRYARSRDRVVGRMERRTWGEITLALVGSFVVTVGFAIALIVYTLS